MRMRHLLLLVAGVVALLLGCLALERFLYEQRRGWHLACLAAAVNVYCQEYGTLPPTLAHMERMGLYGRLPYHAPSNGWEREHSGPSPTYLPVTVPGAADGWIVTIEGVSSRTPEGRRGYVLVGDTSWHAAGPEELAALLAEDDAKRESVGEKRRWGSILSPEAQ